MNATACLGLVAAALAATTSCSPARTTGSDAPLVLKAAPEATFGPPKVYRDLVYARWKATTLHADVYVPPGKGPFPGVFLIHGGGWARGEKRDMTSVAERLAARGYVAINLSYRLAPRWRFPASVVDMKDAARWAAEQAADWRLDTTRLGAFGYSAGAHLALMLGMTGPDAGFDALGRFRGATPRLKAIVAGGAPTELTGGNYNDYYKSYFGVPPWKDKDVYRRASPLTYVSADDPPTFLYHGRNDWIVDVEQSRRLRDGLTAVRVPVEYYEPFFGHVATFLFDETEVQLALAFLDRHLAPPRPPQPKASASR
jgi:acetyl esterase/lipase